MYKTDSNQTKKTPAPMIKEAIVCIYSDSASLQEDLQFCRANWQKNKKELAATQIALDAANEQLAKAKQELATLRKREVQYQQQWAEVEMLYQTAPVGLALFDTELRFLRVNDRLAEINGVPAAEHVGRTLQEIVPGIAEQANALLRQVLATGEPLTEIEIVGATQKDPELTHVWLESYHPLKTPTGEVNGISVVAQEITQRKRTETQLYDAVRYKDAYLAMLAHELRNPLAPLRNAVEVMRGLNLPDSRLVELREIIDRQVEYMARMLDGLLDLSHLACGKLHLEHEELDLVALIRQTAEDFRSIVESLGLTLTVLAPDEPLWVKGDSTRLMQIFGNLLRNAMKFTEAGGQIGITIIPDGEMAIVRVSDTGIGMTAELLAHIFDPFVQGMGPHRRPGLGLGLALVKGLVKLHGGVIEATSGGPGQGAEFLIRLPLSSVTSHNSTEMPIVAASSPLPLRILVIDDLRDMADTLRLLLEHEGHTIAVAYEGEEALKTAQSFQPQTVLCDIGLTDTMSGYDVARILRHDPALRTAHLIAITGYGHEQSRCAAYQSGFDDYLIKPVSLEMLAEVLARGREEVTAQ